MKSERLLSLDILRGITIAGMILVNNPGDWGSIYAPLKHADWNGLTPTDLIFPFFMFIMGVSTFISLRKFNFEFSRDIVKKILKRTLIIFLIGISLSWLSVSFGTFFQLGDEYSFWQRLGRATTNFENVRILGVMQRLAITYGVVSLIAIFVKHKYIPHIIIATLIGYSLLLFFGNGFATDGSNILAIVDQQVLGLNHMFEEFGLDPEGILSTIPSICHVLLGFYCGMLLFRENENTKRLQTLFVIGAFLTFTGFLLSYACPMNKKVWSSTYVLVTCGMGSTLLALLIWVIDIKGYKKWSTPFQAFGVNPLFIYVLAGVMAIVVESIPMNTTEGVMSLKDSFYTLVLEPALGNYFGSFIYALLFVCTTWIVGYILHKKQIYIKI